MEFLLAILLLVFLHRRLRSKKSIKTLPCNLLQKRHTWIITEPKPGTFEVMKCTTCNIIFGPTDEYGRPNDS